VVFVAHHGGYGHDVVYYSDDDGQTYTMSPTLLAKMDEVVPMLVCRLDA
jgi:hypothetical protein